MRKTFHLQVIILGFMLPLTLLGCSKEQDSRSLNADSNLSAQALNDASPRIKHVDFNRPNGTYTKSMAVSDFGAPIEMNWANSAIVNNQLRVRIPANTLSQGNIVNIDVVDGTEYELSFKVKFGAGFDWSRGGKVGFGFHIGNGYTGCNKADNGLGGTARLMWYNASGSKTNKVSTGGHFRPYVYYKDMPDRCGDTFGKESKRLTTDRWYTVKIRVKSNTGTNQNGWVSYEVDGETLLTQAIRWTTNDAYRKIRYVTFHTFRGGSAEYWESTSSGDIFYDDVVINRIAD